MSKKTLFIGAIASIIAINSVLADTTVTSKTYVDTTRQATIPAAGKNVNTPGSTVVTYTGTAGQIGERGIYDGSTTYDSSTDADKLVTASAVQGGLENVSNNLPETTVTYKTCYQEVNGECILWNLTDKNVYGKCYTDEECGCTCGGGCVQNTCMCDGCL